MKNSKHELAAKLSAEFYASIPHNAKHKTDLVTLKDVVKKQDLCQVNATVNSVSTFSMHGILNQREEQ